MTSILERLDDWIRGSLHRFVDRALENNSLILYDQDVRDMEESVDHLEEAATGMYAAARANERRLAQHQEDVTRLEGGLERLAAEGVAPTSERMMVAQAELGAKRGLVADTQAQIERQQAQYETLAKRVVETKVLAQTLEEERPRMESLLALARAYRSVERVELTLDGLRGLGGDTEVAMVAEGIYQRFNAAQARLELIEQAKDLEMLAELEQAEVEEQLARRRERLGLEAEAEGDEAPAHTPTESPKPEPGPEEPVAPDSPDGEG